MAVRLRCSSLSAVEHGFLRTALNDRMKSLLNEVRNIWLFRIRYPWVKIGRNIHCQASTYFWSPRKKIRMGDNVAIGTNCLFFADTTIGNYVMIADFVAFLNSDDHEFNVVGKVMWESGRGDKFDIVIEDDVWIGHGSIILSPARIGQGSIIAAGSVVKGKVERYSIVAGVPAQVVKTRFTPEQIQEHERRLGIRAGGETSPRVA